MLLEQKIATLNSFSEMEDFLCYEGGLSRHEAARAIKSVTDLCKRENESFWNPFSKLLIRRFEILGGK